MKVNEKSFNFAKKILKLYSTKNKQEETKKFEENYVKEDKRIIGTTDYKKYENIAKDIEIEEISKNKNTKEMLKMGCNNDRRKERQLFDKPSKEKIEACKIFKNEGDDFLKKKQWDDAMNAYEKGLLQLFYTFADKEEEEKEVDAVKLSINLNMSMCKINLNKFDEAIGYCQEVLRIDKNNLKAIYRIAFCNFKKENFDESEKMITQGLSIDTGGKQFLDLKKDIEQRKKQIEENSTKLFKKIIK